MALTKIGATLGGSADVITVTQAGHTLTLGYPVKMTASGYAHATANSAPNAEVVGIIIATTTNTLTIALGGRITVDGCVPNVTAGTVLFLQVSAGLLAAAEPSSAGEISKPMAVVTVANSEMIMVQQRGEVLSTGAAVIADGSISLAKMAVNSIDSDQYVDGSIDLVHMSANSIDSDQYVDGSIDTVHIGNDQIDSQHYAAGSVDLEHMSSQSVDEDNLYISNAGNDGEFLSKQSGNNGGLTWAAASSGPSQADQTAIEARTNEDTYIPPDLLQHHKGVAKAWCMVSAAGTLNTPSYNIDSIHDTGTGNRLVTFVTSFSNSQFNIHGLSDQIGTMIYAERANASSFRFYTQTNATTPVNDDRYAGLGCYGDQ